MKNIVMKFIFVCFLFFVCINITKAEDDSCSVTKKSELMTLASKLSVTYEIIETDNVDEEGNYALQPDYFHVKIYNLNSKLRVFGTNETEGKEFQLDYTNIVEDGSLTIRRLISGKVTNYKFVIFGMEDCRNTALRTFRITLPRANYLSGIEKCKDIQDFYLCQPYVTFEINDDVAMKTIANYIEKKESQEEKNEKAENSSNNNIISKTITSFSDHKVYFSLIVIAIGVVATVLVLRKRKSGR